MSSGEVDITRYEKISITKLSEETPSSIKLSFFDALWIPFKPVQKVLIYSCLKTDHLSFSTIVENLKSSLSSVLLDFLPLAGKFTYVPDTQGVEIDLSDLGFTLVEAESNLDVQELSFKEIIDVVSYSKLVPTVDISVLPFHGLAVQVLSQLGVETLVLPAIPQLLKTWTTSFGFKEMDIAERLQYLEYTTLIFLDTTMCKKIINKLAS